MYPLGPTSNLTVLQLSLERPTPGERALVALAVIARGIQVGRWTIRADVLGLPATIEDARRDAFHDRRFTIPSKIQEALKVALAEHHVPDQTLWLHFRQPSGHLAMVPWERLLAPMVPGPILRLSYQQVTPVAPSRSLTVALVAAAPSAKGLYWGELRGNLHATRNTTFSTVVERSARSLLESAPGKTTVHIFAGARHLATLRRAFRKVPTDDKVVIHDPRTAAKYGEAATLPGFFPVGWARLPWHSVPQQTITHSASTSPTSAPQDLVPDPSTASRWLRWMTGELESYSVDVVHFICPGYIARDQGALVLPDDPLHETRGGNSFIDAWALDAFLTKFGAWSVGFSAPRTNFSAFGLRLLADRIARLRAGPVLLHDLASDPSCTALGEAHRFLYRRSKAPTTSGPIALYCYPREARTSAMSQALIGILTLARDPNLLALIEAEGTPRYISAGQRLLEKGAAELLRLTTALDHAAEARQGHDALRHQAEREGIRRAVMQVRRLMAGGARKTLMEGNS